MAATKTSKGSAEETKTALSVEETELEILSDFSSSDGDAMEEVSGDWQYMKTPEKVLEKRQGGEAAAKRGPGLSLEERMNAELDTSIVEKRPPALAGKRQNTTLEDFFTSPKRATSKARPYSKRNASPKSIVSPPHKAHRVLSPQHNKEHRSTTRFIRDVCQKLNEPKQHLMRKVLQQTGKVFVLDLLQQTEKVEEEGGQFVADGTRRRTKGGVFLNLLKSQVTKEQWDTIFEDEKEAQKRRKAMKRRLRYAGEAQAEKDGDAKSPLPVSYKDCLTAGAGTKVAAA
mmetsp:Transcript_6667/g.22971  ORF Transcript_6667/g.22971 Transcript_6667/m.22971 type:complete len:286 (+) Transcript_6667:212-1069(+)